MKAKPSKFTLKWQDLPQHSPRIFFLADSFTLIFLRILGKFLSYEEFFRNAEIYKHVTYIVNH